MRRLLCVMLLVLAGCGHKGKQSDKPVTLDQVPPAAMKAAEAAAKKAFPDLKFETATLRGESLYEITGRTKNGKVHDVEVTATGEILEVE
ncbi:MAG: hypothetical protein ABUL64_03495 [Singulisphaera sp.]